MYIFWIEPLLIIPNDICFFDVCNASIYIVYKFEMMANNMGQTFGKDKHSHIPFNIIPR
jgi:hypothetical protein